MPSRADAPRTCRWCGAKYTVNTRGEYAGHRIGSCPTCIERRRETEPRAAATLPAGLTMPRLPGALCAGQDPELWQTEEPEALEYARSECSLCPALVSCREWSLTHKEVGTWAGLTYDQRERIKRARRR